MKINHIYGRFCPLSFSPSMNNARLEFARGCSIYAVANAAKEREREWFSSPCSTRNRSDRTDKAPFFHGDPSWHRCLACLPGQQITSHFWIRVGACSTVSDSLLSPSIFSFYLSLLLFLTLPFSHFFCFCLFYSSPSLLLLLLLFFFCFFMFIPSPLFRVLPLVSGTLAWRKNEFPVERREWRQWQIRDEERHSGLLLETYRLSQR